VKRYEKYRRKASSIVKRYGKSKEKEVKLKSFGKYRRKVI
jgi:hypothetical protein